MKKVMPEDNQQEIEAKSNQRQLFLKQYYLAQEKNDPKQQANAGQTALTLSNEENSVMQPCEINTSNYRPESVMKRSQKQVKIKRLINA